MHSLTEFAIGCMQIRNQSMSLRLFGKSQMLFDRLK
jgi:hypothetical protein